MAPKQFLEPVSNLAQRLLESPEMLAAYKARRLSAAQIAAKTGHQVSYVMSTLSRMGVKRPRIGASTYEIQKKTSVLAQTRREFRLFLAEKVKKGDFSLKTAAEAAGCSERTMRRYIERTDDGAT